MIVFYIIAKPFSKCKFEIEFSENKIPLSGDDVLFFYKMGQDTVDKLDRGLI